MLVDDVAYVTGWAQCLPCTEDTIREVRHRVREVLATWGYDSSELDDAETVASELATNAIKHSHAGHYTFRIWPVFLTASAVIEVEDMSQERPRRPKSLGDYETSGRGLQIIEALWEKWWVVPEWFGKRVCVRMPAPRREQA